MFILVAYDVPAKRTVIFHSILARYLIRLQFSVFAGDLKDSQEQRMLRELQDALSEEDRILLVTTANRRNVEIEVIEQGRVSKFEGHKGGMII